MQENTNKGSDSATTAGKCTEGVHGNDSDEFIEAEEIRNGLFGSTSGLKRKPESHFRIGTDITAGDSA